MVILLTLLVQGLTLPYVITRSGLLDDLLDEEAAGLTKQKMKQGLKQHVNQWLKNNYEHEPTDYVGMEKFLMPWEERARATEESEMPEKTKALFAALLDSQRYYLTQLNKDPTMDEDIIRQQLYQLDLEEERLKMS